MADKVLKIGSTINSPLYTTGYKNKIINGGMEIAQRGASSASNPTSGVKTVDRWALDINLAGSLQILSEQRNDLTYNNTVYTSHRMTTNPPSNLTNVDARVGFYQMLDGTTCVAMKGNVATLSFLCKVNVAGVYTVSFVNAARTYSYISEFTMININVATAITLSVYFDPTKWNASFGEGVGGYLYIGSNGGTNIISLQTDTWVLGDKRVTYSTTPWTTAANYFEVTRVQLEIGTGATSFETRDYGIELMLCKRDYQLITSWTGSVAIATTMNIVSPLNPPMRTNTLAFTKLATTLIGYHGASGPTPWNSWNQGTPRMSKTTFGATVTAVTGLTVNQAVVDDSSGTAIGAVHTGY